MDYTVKQGDYLAKIASQFGIADWLVVWQHPSNKALRDSRRNPNVLFPGDKLHIPEPAQKSESFPTGAKHRLVRKGRPLRLRLVLRDLSFKPMAKRACTLIVDGASFPLVSGGDGLIEVDISATAAAATLEVAGEGDPVKVPILIGHLDPVDTLSGQRARLNNLGYFVGPDEPDGERLFASAVEEFQLEQMGHAAVDGKCGPKTQTKLKELHGC